MLRIFISLMTSGFIFSNDLNYFEKFVNNYFTLSKSKMELSPTIGQDIREGYFRSYGIYYSELVMDSLDNSSLSPYEAAIRHFYNMDEIRLEVESGRDFKYLINPKLKVNYNINYFSSSKN